MALRDILVDGGGAECREGDILAILALWLLHAALCYMTIPSDLQLHT